MVQVFEFNYELCHWERQCAWDRDSKVVVINGTHRKFAKETAIVKGGRQEDMKVKQGRRGESKVRVGFGWQCHSKLAKNAFAAFHFYLASKAAS